MNTYVVEQDGEYVGKIEARGFMVKDNRALTFYDEAYEQVAAFNSYSWGKVTKITE